MSRPLFELKFRDMDQLLDIRFLADEAEIPVNEWILRQIERVPLLKGARLAAEQGLAGNRTATGAEALREQGGAKLARAVKGEGGNGLATRNIQDGGKVGDKKASSGNGTAVESVPEYTARGSNRTVGDVVYVPAGDAEAVGVPETFGAVRENEQFAKMDEFFKNPSGTIPGEKFIVGPPPHNPTRVRIETDAVGTAGCKVTVSRPMVGEWETAKEGFREPRKADKVVLAEAHYSPVQPKAAKTEWKCSHCGNGEWTVKQGKTVCFGCGRSVEPGD